MKPKTLLVLALALILVGDVLAWGTQTSWGDIEVRDVRWTGTDGLRMSGLLYVPSGATSETPAPGIVAIHGYINSRETQTGFAIELARRGYVVLASDQTGHGYSDPPANANGFGGPDALAYLRSLDFVDLDNVGLEGHSMGGWAVLMAAAAHPDGYRSLVLEGSSTGTAGAPAGTPEFPRNLAVVFSRYDEFSALMWGSPVAGNVAHSEKLMETFGTPEPVEPGRVYGSTADGTARVLHQPPVTHAGDHLSRVAIGHAIEWFETTLDGGDPLPAGDQVWYWKELGTLISAVGMILLLFPVGALLLRIPFFAEVRSAPVPAKAATGASWWLAAAVFVALPAVTLFPFKDLAADWTSTSVLLPQNVTTQILGWALLVGAITVALLVIWHTSVNRKRDATLDHYGLTWSGRFDLRRVAKSLLLALIVVGAAYATLVISAAIFTVDYRFWVFAIKPMSALHLRIALTYAVPFLAFFVVLGVALYGQLRRDDLGPAAEMVVVMLLCVAGFAGLLAYQYVPLLTGGTLADPAESLWTIIAIQFLPIMTIVGLVTAYFYRKTGAVYVGGFVSGLLVTWIVVAGQATHHAF